MEQIQDEDADGIQLLETLLEEFNIEKGHQDLVTFLNGYWAKRIQQVRSEQEHVDHSKIKELRVVIHRECSDTEYDYANALSEFYDSDSNTTSEE